MKYLLENFGYISRYWKTFISRYFVKFSFNSQGRLLANDISFYISSQNSSLEASYIEYGILTKNGGPGQLPLEAFEQIFNPTIISMEVI